MTDDQRSALEARADRARRRGDFAEALRLYGELVDAFPEDRTLAEKVAQTREALQPLELSSPKTQLTDPRTAAAPHTPEQEGERLYSLGDFAGAAAAYRRALAQRPESELIRERLYELFQLAQAAPGHSPTDRQLPTDASDLLQALLDRIAARKRLPK